MKNGAPSSEVASFAITDTTPCTDLPVAPPTFDKSTEVDFLLTQLSTVLYERDHFRNELAQANRRIMELEYRRERGVVTPKPPTGNGSHA